MTAVASITGVPLDTSNKPEVVIPTHKQSEDDDSLPTKGTYDDYRDVNKIDEKPVHGSAITDHSTRMSVQLLIIARAITDHSTQFDGSAITDHSTRMLVQLLIIARGALVLDKLALLVLSTNRFQYIPFQYITRVLAVLVGVRSGATFDEQISIHPISIHPTSSCRARWRR